MIAPRLRALGIIPTAQRVHIAGFLLTESQHVSADRLLFEVNKRGCKRVSKATVYNTLRLFTERGLVREVLVDPCKVFYDSNIRPHHHFYNMETGVLSDIPVDQIQLTGLPVLPPRTEAVGVEVIVRIRPVCHGPQ